MLDLGLSGLQAIDIAEGDGDCGAAIGEVAPSEPDDNGRGSDGKQPYPVEPLGTDAGMRLLVTFIVGVWGSIVFGGLSHSRSATVPATASHMSRESNTAVASIVMITTAAKATSPGPECTAVNEPNCSTATSMATEKMSMLDQRPMVSMVRYSCVRPTRKRLDFTRVAISIQVSPNSLTSGRTILAMNTMTAKGTRSLCTSSMTPLRIVLCSSRPNCTVVSTGRVFAGMYSVYPATTKASVRSKDAGL